MILITDSIAKARRAGNPGHAPGNADLQIGRLRRTIICFAAKEIKEINKE